MLIEILFRGYTHWSMGIVGGLCFVLIGLLNTVLGPRISMLTQMILSALIITSLEYISGIIVNIYLGWHVWDYSQIPFNLMGQICLLYTALWFLLSPVIIVSDDWIRWKFFGESKPHYKLI